MQIRKGTTEDIEAVSALYDDVNDYLESHTNFPGWRKGIYPAREDAALGVSEGGLFVAAMDGRIVGTFILRHQPEAGYALVDWQSHLDEQQVLVLYTFAVHPQYLHQGIGKKMLEYILAHAAQAQVRAIRLDVYEKNVPAIRLYEKLGFQYMDTVDLGYGMYGLDRFRLYQRLI
ncbi:MAG: GNAT family N-acetyltransferase [bacterium]|nr:GNAT family N-acetyltransferase [bacterium]